MRRYARRRGRRPIRRLRRGRFTRRTKRVPKTFKRYVKREIGRRIENKEYISYGANQSVKSAGSGVSPVVFGLIPSMSNGTNDSTLIGNELKPKYGVLRGHVNLLPYNATTNPNPGPVYVKIWILKSLLLQGQLNAPSTQLDFTSFFKINNSAVSFQGNMMDLELPVNQEYWRVLSTKTMRLGATSYSATGPVSSGTYFDNSVMSRRFVFNWGRYCRKILKYADNGGTCTNNNVYFVLQVVGADGQTTTNYYPVEYHYVNHFKYEDA